VIHPFLIGIFFVMFIFSHNIFVLPPQETIFPLFVILVSTTGLFFGFTFLLKNSKKSGILVSLYLILFFSFGHIYNIVQGLTIGEFDIGRYRYLLIPYIITFIIGTIFIVKTKKNFFDITKIVNIVSVVLIIAVFAGILSDSMNESTQTLDYSEDEFVNKTHNLTNFETNQDVFPNVYYIILDEYGSEESLNRFFNYDNQEFLSFLKQKEFFVVDNSFSNYPSTKLSLGSTLNMKHLEYLSDQIGRESRNHHILDQLVMENFVMENFKSNGYEIVNMGALWGPYNEFKIADQNLCENKEMNRDSLTRELIETSIVFYFFERMVEQERRDVILCTFEKMSKIKSEKPIFAFIHILLPHAPYIFGPNGESLVSGTSVTSEVFSPKEAYIDQLKFANKKIKNSIEEILHNENKNAIIILQSDTGSGFNIDWGNPTNESIFERHSNLSAYYIPNNDYRLFENKLTSVNTFPLIFNSYFKQNFEFLPDKMYWSSSNQPYNLKEVTNVLLYNDSNQSLFLDDGDTFGNEIGSLGDLDGDGINDIAVGASEDDDGGKDRGAVYILFLNEDGTVKKHQKISDTKGNFEGKLDDGDTFGRSTITLGDLDGDGINELAIGAYKDDDGGKDRGAVYILFLNEDGTVKKHQKISDTKGNFEGEIESLDYFGRDIDDIGDLDGDGINELAIGAFRDDNGGKDRGAVYILFLNEDGTVKKHQKIPNIMN